jgi:hypothetical protein
MNEELETKAETDTTHILSLGQLTEADWHLLQSLTRKVMEVLVGGKGVVVVLTDANGDGNGTVDAVGSHALAPRLVMSAATMLYESMLPPEGKPLQ